MRLKSNLAIIFLLLYISISDRLSEDDLIFVEAIGSVNIKNLNRITPRGSSIFILYSCSSVQIQKSGMISCLKLDLTGKRPFQIAQIG